MSHVAAVECIIRDLDVLKVAGEKLGLEFMEGQKTHRWFGRFMNDWGSERAAVRKGYDPKTFGTCDHALRIKGQPHAYEIGVTARADGDGFDLVYDTYGSGHALEKLAGTDLLSLRNEVSAETATRALSQRGWRVTRENEANTVRLTATR